MNCLRTHRSPRRPGTFVAAPAAIVAITTVSGLTSIAAAQDGSIWLRDFPGPSREIPILFSLVGETFCVNSPGLGILREASTIPLYDTTTECRVETELVPDTTGYDIVYRIRNETATPLSLPRLQICGNLLEPVLDYLDSRFGCNWGLLDAQDGGPEWTPDLAYPSVIYSPVVVVRDSRLTVGFSLKYPMMRYQHQVRTSLGRSSAGTLWGDAWNARFHLDGSILPGESREYTVSVRYNLPEDWIYSLEPYRTYFQAQYGPVQYVQDMTPCFGANISDPLWLAEDNRRGFGPLRPDVNGWDSSVDRDLAFCLDAGYRRVMLWAPSGCYFEHRNNNFPPQIQSDWPAPMEESQAELSRFAASGVDLLFWWGRASQFADRWDDDELEDFDPQNTVQRRKMLTEWFLGLLRGGSGAGLEFISHMEPWQSIPWIQTLRFVAFGPTTIVGEPGCTDILNLYIPVFIQGSRNPEPHFLADYIVPGREIWCLLKGDDATLERALEVISWGQTVCTKSRDLEAWPLYDPISSAR